MDERVGVVDRRDDLEAVRLEQAHHPVAQEREVLGDHDPHGSSTRTIVGPPRGLVTASVPSSASTRRRSPVRPPPAGSAPPRPSSSISTASASPRRATATATRLAPECLAAFASASATTKYAADSTAGGEPLVELDRDRHGQRAPVGERRERGAEPAVGEHRRVDPAREVAQLLERLADADARLGDELLRALGVGRELLLGEAEAHPERDEPGLRAVVEVALDPPQLGVLRVDGAGARRLEHVDRRASRLPRAA